MHKYRFYLEQFDFFIFFTRRFFDLGWMPIKVDLNRLSMAQVEKLISLVFCP